MPHQNHDRGKLTMPWSMPALDPRTLVRRSLDRNEVLFRQGDKVTAIYFVEAGRLRLERRTFDGRLLVLGTTPAGEFFVEAALFADTYHCDAVATEPSQVGVYPKEVALNALRTDSTSAMSLLGIHGASSHGGAAAP
jgi:CRP/FNR family transcriptional regulator, dissimilatory nitrate respiration regulator